jgi:hypothetical protein
VTEYAPYQGGAFQPPPAYSGPARALRVPAWLAMIALGAIGAEALAGAGLQAYLYPATTGAVETTEAQYAVSDFLYGPEQGVATLLLVLAGISFVVWLHRARTNLDDPHSPELTWKRGWAVGGWFLPLANFVIPQLVISEIDRESERRADEAEGRPHERHPGVVTTWIVLWSLFVVVSQLGGSALQSIETGPSVLLAVGFGIFEAVTAGSAIRLVWRVTANQNRLRDARTRFDPARTGFLMPAPPAPWSSEPVSPTPRPASPTPRPAAPASSAPAAPAPASPGSASPAASAPAAPGSAPPAPASPGSAFPSAPEV